MTLVKMPKIAGTSILFPVVSSGSPSRIRSVLRISLGITTRPSSSHYVKRGTKKLTIFSKSPVLLGF